MTQTTAAGARRRPTDLEVARAIHHNQRLREEANPERDPDADADAFIASLLDELDKTGGAS